MSKNQAEKQVEILEIRIKELMSERDYWQYKYKFGRGTLEAYIYELGKLRDQHRQLKEQILRELDDPYRNYFEKSQTIRSLVKVNLFN